MPWIWYVESIGRCAKRMASGVITVVVVVQCLVACSEACIRLLFDSNTVYFLCILIVLWCVFEYCLSQTVNFVVYFDSLLKKSAIKLIV
jgi:hypothetical protein